MRLERFRVSILPRLARREGMARGAPRREVMRLWDENTGAVNGRSR